MQRVGDARMEPLSLAGCCLSCSIGLSTLQVPVHGQAAPPCRPAAHARAAREHRWPTYGGDLAQHALLAARSDQRRATSASSRSPGGSRPTPSARAPSSTSSHAARWSTACSTPPPGSRRAVVALDAATGEMLWMHRLDEGKRGDAAPRQLSGRGLAYWTDGKRGAHRLRHARLSAGRARREDRPSGPDFGNERHRRSQARTTIRTSIR